MEYARVKRAYNPPTITKRDAKGRMVARKPESEWTLTDYREAAQTAFNRYIRLRDEARGCISCDAPANARVVWHAGHFKTRKAAPHLAMHVFNVHRQCAQCNHFGSGEVARQREGIAARYGAAMVERLESAQWEASKDPAYYQRVREVFARRYRHLLRLRERLSERVPGEGQW